MFNCADLYVINVECFIASVTFSKKDKFNSKETSENLFFYMISYAFILKTSLTIGI